jgi:hypothetical protein
MWLRKEGMPSKETEHLSRASRNRQMLFAAVTHIVEGNITNIRNVPASFMDMMGTPSPSLKAKN